MVVARHAHERCIDRMKAEVMLQEGPPEIRPAVARHEDFVPTVTQRRSTWDATSASTISWLLAPS